MDKAKSLKEEK